MLKKVGITALLLTSLFPLFPTNPVEAATETNPLVFATHGQYPALSPDGKTVIVGKGRPDNNIEHEYLLGMYDVETGSLIKEIESKNNTDHYYFSPNGTYLYGAGDYTNFLDSKTGTSLFTLPFYFPYVFFKETNDSIAAFAYSAKPNMLIKKNTLTMYDLSTRTKLFEKTYEGDKRMRAAIHPTEPIVAVSYGRNIEIINYETGQTLHTITNPFNLSEDKEFYAIRYLRYSPNSEKLLVLSDWPVTMPFKQYDADNSYKESAIQIDAYVHEPQKTRDILPEKITYSPNETELFLHSDGKLKVFDSKTGEYKREVSGDLNDVVFSENMKKVAYTKNQNINSGLLPEYVEVQDFPIQEKPLPRIEFKDPYIQLRQGKSTYYGLEYIDEANQATLLEPSEVTLEPLDANIVDINSANRIIAKEPGSTIIKATYHGFIDYLNVEVQSLAKSRIVVAPLYDSSMKITGTAPENIPLFAHIGNKSYTITTKPDGSFTIDLDQPLGANTFVWFMYYLEDLFPAEAPEGADYLFEHVLRDTVAPAPPTITQIDEQAGIIQGKTEPYATVDVFDQSASQTAKSASISTTSKRSTKAGKSGTFTIKMASLEGKTLRTTAQDLAGNQSKPTITKVADHTPPAVPTVKPLSHIASTISGTAEAGVTILVKKGATLLAQGKATTNGTFTIKIPKQTTGTMLTITALDAANNVSKPATMKVIKAPSTPTVQTISNKTVTVTGKAQAYTTVYVKKGTAVLGSTKATSKGTYAIRIPKQSAGVTLSIMAKNNQHVYSYTTKTTVKDVIPPSTPVVQSIYSTHTTASGKTDRYTTVKIYRGTTLLGTTKATKTGTWKMTIQKQKKNTTLKIYSFDQANNRSAARVVTVK